MRIEIIPENDFDMLELGLITPEELGTKMAKSNIEKLRKEIAKKYPNGI